MPDEADAGRTQFTRWYLENESAGDASDPHTCVAGDTVTVHTSVRLEHGMDHAWIQFALWGEDDEVVLSATSRDGGAPAYQLDPGVHALEMTLRIPLRDGHYALELALCDEHGRDVERVELPPRLVVLPRESRVLPRESQGIVDEAVQFDCHEASATGEP